MRTLSFPTPHSTYPHTRTRNARIMSRIGVWSRSLQQNLSTFSPEKLWIVVGHHHVGMEIVFHAGCHISQRITECLFDVTGDV